jgi:hypothetical protein
MQRTARFIEHGAAGLHRAYEVARRGGVANAIAPGEGETMTTTRLMLPLILGTALIGGSCDQNNNGQMSGDDAAAPTTGEGDTEAPVDECTDRPEGAYGNCAFADPSNPGDLSQCGGSGALCVEDFPGKATAAVCAFDGCESDCECPAAPGSGTAAPVCGVIIDGGPKQCHLGCEEGQACPDGMFCYGGFMCAFPASSGGTPYGDCINFAAEDACGPTQSCIVDNQEAPTAAVCGEIGCETEETCPPAPETGDAPVLCAPLISGQGIKTCHLNCAGGQTCPDGMSCYDVDGICVWNEGMPDPNMDQGGTGTGG